MDYVKNILLKGHGYDPKYHIGVFVEKSLMVIDYEQVKIHDLIVQMGKEIVESESPSNLENWSRLWSYKGILFILEDYKVCS